MVLFRYLNPADHSSRKIAKTDKDFAKRLDFMDIKTTVKIRDNPKILKKNSIVISVISYIKRKASNLCINKML